MRIFKSIASIIYVASIVSLAFSQSNNTCIVNDEERTNGCIDFSISSGTGCAWMCNYCASQLGTNNYYFTDGVCSYQEGQGCVGNPISGKKYTCCMV
jgi:hypothetical protein